MEAFLKYGLLGLAAAGALAAAVLSVSGPAGTGLMAAIAAGALLCASAIARSPRLGALLTAVGAFGSNAYLFSRKWESAAGSSSICDISATINCDVVNTSAWSEAFGLPVTLLGMGGFAGLAIAALLSSDTSRRFHQLTSLFAGASVLVSLFLGYQSLQLGAICVLCISIYVASGLLLWAGLAGLKLTAGATDEGDVGGLLVSKEFLGLAGTFVVVVGLGGASWQAQKEGAPTSPLAGRQDGDEPLPPELLGALYEQPGGEIRLDGTEPVMGNPNARYTIVEWADFGCPHCAIAGKEMKTLLQKQPDTRLIFKVYPLTGDCNPALQPRGPERCQAAYAAECAHQQGRFPEMQTMLFENQGYFSFDDIGFMAKQIGLDTARFGQCLTAPETTASVLSDARAGGDVGLQGTPAFFLKGTHGERWISIRGGPDAIEALIEAHAAGTDLPEPAPASAQLH